MSPPGPQSLLPNVLLSLGVSVVLLGLLEGGSRLIERTHPAPERAVYLWDWEQRWDGEFYTVGPPGTGWPPWEEFNAEGVRDRAHPIEKLEGAWRVAFLGDSVTMGAGLEAGDAYPRVLEARLAARGSEIEVFSFALWGWSTRQQRLAYERLARKYRPDQVLLGVCLNDVPELQNNLSRPPRWISALHERSALVRRVVNASGREIQSVEQLFEEPEPTKVAEGWRRFFDEVRALEAELARDGAQLSILIFPFRFQLAPEAPPPLAQRRIQEFCGAEALRCLDLLPALRELGEAAFLDYDHLSRAGSDAVAEAILANGLLPERPSYAAALVEALGARPGQTAAQAAAWAAGLLAGGAEPGTPEAALPGLVEALADDGARVRAAAAWGLARIGPSAGPALRTLSKALREDASAAVRAAAATALGALGSAISRPAVPMLFEALDDPSETVRAHAAQALWKSSLAPPHDVPRLAARLQSEDGYVRAFAAWTLGNMGAAAQDAVPALIAALEQEDAFLRSGPALALAKMGAVAREAVPALIQGLRSADHQRRRNAARALGKLGPEAKQAVPELLGALEDDDQRVRAQVARALGRIGPAARDAIPALRRATRDPEPAVRREAEDALRRIRSG